MVGLLATTMVVRVRRATPLLLIAGSLVLSCHNQASSPQLRPLPLSVISARLPPASPKQVEAEKLPPPIIPPGSGMYLAQLEEQAQAEAYNKAFPYYGVAFHMLAQVYAEPNTDSLVIGYLRRGSRFRAGEPVRGRGCDNRWYPVEGGGFACDGRGFVLGTSEKRFEPSPAPPDMYSSLPYRYAKTLAEDVPQYFRLPTDEEERLAADAIHRLRSYRATLAASGMPPKPVATTLDDAESDAGVSEERQWLPDFVRMTMRPGFYVSLDGVEEAPSGRRFARTVRGAYVALDKLQDATVSPYHGIRLWDGLQLALGLIHFASTQTLRLGPDAVTYVEGPELPRFASVHLDGRRVVVGKRNYLKTIDGLLVDERAVRIARRAPRPSLVPSAGRWIDVDLSQQVLVSYEGDTPVFATLVATGKPGFETPTGLFRIHAKHISATMDGADGTDEMYSIEDVPFAMYFKGSLALHAAFWHDRFGRVRSHGCVNLAPRDAHFLFEWTTPVNPPGFHGVVADPHKHSTYVSIRSS